MQHQLHFRDCLRWGVEATTFLSDARQLEVDFLQSWVVILNKVPSRSPLVSIRVKTLSNTNLVTSRHIKRDEDLLLVDVCRSKTSLLKLPHDCLLRLRVNRNCERKRLYVF